MWVRVCVCGCVDARVRFVAPLRNGELGEDARVCVCAERAAGALERSSASRPARARARPPSSRQSDATSALLNVLDVTCALCAMGSAYAPNDTCVFLFVCVSPPPAA